MPVSTVSEFGNSKPPVQLIAMGCPGSGKSNALKKMATVDDENLFRITFHQELSYADFVGTYKPVPLYVSSLSSTYLADGTPVEGERGKWVPVVMYEYRPGPFINAYIRAVQNPKEDVVLIIEEINRANPAAVFGDILQLLDRDDDGNSDYFVDTSDDLSNYLTAKFEQSMPRDHAVQKARRLRLPANLYLWGTMNRADESVNFVDSAFLRRWNLFYLPYNTECSYGSDIISVNGDEMLWEDVRQKINHKLSQIDGVEDDKFIGPYFLKRSELKDRHAVFSKLITYLWHDVIPMERDELFDGQSLSAIYQKWHDGQYVLKL